MPKDDYPGQGGGLQDPSEDWSALTPHDSTDFEFLPKAILVGATAGSFVAVSANGSTATFYGPAGALIAIRPKRINATGLTGGMTFVGLK
jgi:hypothetical protein